MSKTMDQPIFQTLDRVTQFPYTRGEYVRRLAWEIVQATLFRLPIPRAYGWRRFLLRSFGAQLAPTCGVQRRVKIVHPWLLKIGSHSIVANGTTLYNLGPIEIGEHTAISQDCYLCAGSHDHAQPTLPLQRLPIRIGSGVWIAAQVFVCPDVTIGNNTVVGARSVVTKDLPENVVAAGNPARVIKPRIS